MKFKYILFATSLFAFTAANTAVSAAEEPGAKTGKAEAAKTDSTKKTEATKKQKKLKRHSHTEEKTGMPMPEPASGGKNESMKNMKNMKNMDKHDHTKDRH